MKITTQILIVGLVVFLVGFCMLMWGPEKHETIATVTLFTGMGVVGIKPAASAIQTQTTKGKGS